MARPTGFALALALLSLAVAAMARPAMADGSPQSSLGSLQGVGSTQQLSQPTGGRVTGIAVDPPDAAGKWHFNGIPNRISQGNGGDTYDVGSANGGVWKTTNFVTADTANRAGIGVGDHNTGALRSVGSSNIAQGATALRVK